MVRSRVVLLRFREAGSVMSEGLGEGAVAEPGFCGVGFCFRGVIGGTGLVAYAWGWREEGCVWYCSLPVVLWCL